MPKIAGIRNLIVRPDSLAFSGKFTQLVCISRSRNEKLERILSELRDETETKLEQKIVDFSRLESYSFSDTHVGYCCLGTTSSNEVLSPSICNISDNCFEILISSFFLSSFFLQQEFIRVERDLVHNCAKILHRDGCEEFHLGKLDV